MLSQALGDGLARNDEGNEVGNLAGLRARRQQTPKCRGPRAMAEPIAMTAALSVAWLI